MGKPDAPKPPDPKKVAGAQTATNLGTAIANTTMGNVNQITPDGSLTYAQTGTYKWTDPNTGKTYDVPQYTSTQSLSPEAQAIRNQTLGAQLNLGTAANKLSGNINTDPANFDTSAIEGHLSDLARQRLDPRFEQERAAMEARLANQGLQPGSEAWKHEMDQFGQTKNDAYNNLALTGRQQALGELLTQRSQPINEISALLSGSQVSNPMTQMNQPSMMPTVDYAGLKNQNYAQRYDNYKTKMDQYSALAGGLFGLGSSGITAWGATH